MTDPTNVAHHRSTLAHEPPKGPKTRMVYPTDATGTTDQRRRNAWSKFWKKVLEYVTSVPTNIPILPIFDSVNHTVTIKDASGTTLHTFSGTEADDICYCSNALGAYEIPPPNDP